MKRVGQLEARPPVVDAYCAANPHETNWETFKDECRDGYRDLVTDLTAKQRHLCAFCEVDLLQYDRQVEHWRPKRLATPVHNLTLDVTNLTVSCENVTKAHWFADLPHRAGNPDPGPNASCGPAKGDEDPNDLNPKPYSPVDLPATPRLFSVQGDGRLAVDAEAATAATLEPERLQATLELLNLNCTRLAQARREVVGALDKQFADLTALRGLTDFDALLQMAQEQLKLDPQGALPAFVTTLRWYFGDLAESTLDVIPHWSATP